MPHSEDQYARFIASSKQKPRTSFIQQLEERLLGSKPYAIRHILMWLSIPTVAMAAYLIVIVAPHLHKDTPNEESLPQLDQIEMDLQNLDTSSNNFLHTVEESLAI